MGARLGVVIGALVVAALLAAGYFLFWQEKPEPRRAEAPVTEPAPADRQQAESPAAPEGTQPQPDGAAPGGMAEPQAPEPGSSPSTPAEPATTASSDGTAGSPPETGSGRQTAPGSGAAAGRASQPETVEPSTAEPRTAESRGAEPQTAEPQAGEPRATEPQGARTRTAESQVVEPQVVEPRAVEPQAIEPRAVEPRAVEPRAVEPRSAEPAPQPEAAPSEPAPEGQVAAVPGRLPAQPDAGEATETGLPRRAVPSFDVVHVERSGSAVIAGRAEPGSRITILRNGEELGTAETNAAGEWVFLTDRPLAPGDHQLSLVARGRDGGEVEAPRVVVISVPKPQIEVARPAGAPEDAEPVAPGTAEPRGPVAVALDKSGEGDVVVLQGIDAGVAVGDLVLETLRYDAEGRVTVTGKVAPEGRVFAYIDGAFVGEARGDAQGGWRLRAAEPVAIGLHRLRLDQVDAAGEVLARLETPFARSTLLTDLPEGERLVIVQPGNSLWRIAQRTLGEGLRYTVIFEANDAQIRDPDLIYPGQVFVVPEEKGPPS